MNNLEQTQNLEFENNEYLKNQIIQLFEKLDSARQKQKDDIKEVENAIFLKENDKFQMTDLFELYQTFKAHIWENLYSNIELLFDVKGQNAQSEKTAMLQKHNLQKYFENAKLQNVLDDAIDFLIRKSEAIVFIGWKTAEKFVRRKRKILGKNEIVVEKKKIYDGLDLRAIDPENIVFDTDNKSYYIYRTYVHVNDLESIKSFNCMDEEMLLKIKTFAQTEKKKTFSQGINGEQIELLEYWGDIKTKDGRVERNKVVVVAGRNFVVRNSDNPYIIMPFVVMELLKDPDTHRGLPYLKTALPMKNKSQEIFINQLRALEFITNPAYLAPKGAFSNIDQKAEPGKIIEYEAALLPQAPTPLNMTGALQGWEFLSYLKSIEETSTGIFKNFSGVIDKVRSATEVQVAVGGQNSRLAMVIDLINQYLIIPIVEKSADLISNLIFEEEQLFMTHLTETPITEIIDDNVRNGDYKYLYGDRNSMQIRKFKLKEMLDICTNLLKIFPELKDTIDPTEALKFTLEQYGYDNFERFKKHELSGKSNSTPNNVIERNGEQQRMENI